MSADRRELDQIERWVQAVIMHPAGVEHGARSLSAQSVFDAPPSIDDLIEPSRALTSAERLAIYNRAYFARLLECLGDQFPVVRKTVGDEAFGDFALSYLTSCPSQSYTLAQLGARFATFLAESRPQRESGEGDVPGWPEFLVDLAELEWSVSEVFDAPGGEDLPPLDAARLGEIAPDAWPGVRLVPLPCLRLLVQRFPINEFYGVVRREERVPEVPAPRESYMALSRRDYVVRRFPLSRPQYVVLDALIGGRTVGEAIELAAAERDVAELVDDMRRWFAQWASEGFFVDVQFAQS